MNPNIKSVKRGKEIRKKEKKKITIFRLKKGRFSGRKRFPGPTSDREVKTGVERVYVKPHLRPSV